MLEAALKVVEAARSLKLVRKGRKTASELPAMELARAIDVLRMAVEAFDRETGAGRDAKGPAPAPRPDYATPPQIEDEGFVARQRMVARIKGLEASPEETPMEEAAPEADPDARPADPDTSGRPVVPADAVPAPGPAREAGPGHDFAEEGLFFDGDESAADLLLVMEAIDQKLAYAVSKVGWSPRLRALAAAQRIAFENMFIEVDGPRGWVRIPARNWGTLSLAIAEAALDQDLSLALPKPAPKEPGPGYRPPVPRPQ